MKLKTLYLTLYTDKPVKKDVTHLQGYIAGLDSNRPILNPHAQVFPQNYPRLQCRVVEGIPTILGIEEEVERLLEIIGTIKELHLGNVTYQVTLRSAYEQGIYLHSTESLRHYQFVTPWLALNEEDCEHYQNLQNWQKKKDLINQILVDNILSMAKGLGIVVDQRLRADTCLEEVPISYKRIEMIGFVGDFRVNYSIPEYFGLGMGISRGFGVVKSLSIPGTYSVVTKESAKIHFS
ncbi:hypothetical protein RJ40_01835 [Methanofollis aquaemaris]|uniref:Cas6b C-terminal domain-containing protein n=1 Tax=Methanofollis aquaemaris TaxID=126734 RepID=A0A8A3S262_9EURY|nr:CRISPR-associated endonuclease Cas6 [Methanofollis aquaemaris]QSZ66328.1 hypothetical protein RJ40_01835 [Methanofollis aquaemaris]